MKTIIAGSRSITDRELVNKAVMDSGFTISVVFCGCAQGVDNLGREWAVKRGIPVRLFPAEWDLHGKSAGMIRNEQMSSEAEACILIWDGVSKGSQNMKKKAIFRRLKFHELIVDSPAGKNIDGL